MEKLCKTHGLVDHVKRTDRSSWRCKQCSQDKVKRRRKKLKVMAVNHMGGSCNSCGYSKCIEALEFHHIDPLNKDFSISSANKSWDKIKIELGKCVMLCANCHRELHNSLADGILGEHA